MVSTVDLVDGSYVLAHGECWAEEDVMKKEQEELGSGINGLRHYVEFDDLHPLGRAMKAGRMNR